MPKDCRGLWHKDFGYLIFKGEVWKSEWSGAWFGAFETDYMKVHVNIPLEDLTLDFW